MIEQPNMSYIHELSGGDKEFEAKLLEVVKRELPEEVEVYRMNFKENNFSEAALNVHKIKHKISILGLEKSYEFAESFETELREGISKGDEEFEKILQQMLLFIDQL